MKSLHTFNCFRMAISAVFVLTSIKSGSEESLLTPYFKAQKNTIGLTRVLQDPPMVLIYVK